MCSKCENCELFLEIDRDRIQQYKDLSLKNIELHRRLTEKHDLIIILKKKLLEKRSNFLSDYMLSLIEHTQNENNQNNSGLEKNAVEKSKINEYLEILSYEKDLFQKQIEENEKYFVENISYLNGLIDYFRESLFDELDKSNKLKQYFIQKMSGIATTSHHIILNTLKDEGERLTSELKSRYQKTIQKTKEEIERQNLLVLKLRKHNRNLYLLIQKTKMENEIKITALEKNLQDLKNEMKKLKDKNNYLHTQIKLEVEGCQNDIYDARKKIRNLTIPRSEQCGTNE